MNNDLVFNSKADFRTFNTEMTPSIVSEVEVYVMISNRAWSGGATLMSNASLIKVMIFFYSSLTAIFPKLTLELAS